MQSKISMRLIRTYLFVDSQYLGEAGDVGEVGEYFGDVGDICAGDVGEYRGEAGLKDGLVGE